jgi:putative sporulation protein YtaF
VNFFSLLTLAIAVSLDSFGVGVAYGVRRIRVPLGSFAIITLCTAFTLVLAVFAGEMIAAVLSPELTQALGGVLLVGIGLVAVLNQVKGQLDADQPSQGLKDLEAPASSKLSPGERNSSRSNRLATITAVLERPAAADADQSKSISAQEALILGLAVSLDSFVAGIGIRLMGYSPWLIIITMAAMSSMFIYLGIRIGIAIAGRQGFKQLPYFHGTLLIVIGLHRFF